MPMTARMARFVAEYQIDGNIVQSALRAGYAPANVKSNAAKLFLQPTVRAAIAAAEQRRVEGIEIEAGRVLRQAARVAFADLRGLFDAGGRPKSVAEIDAATRAAVSVVESRDQCGRPLRRLRARGKLAALMLLAKHVFALNGRGASRPPGPFIVTKYTQRMARFAAEYALDLNGRQAAIRAGYKHKTAANAANRLLRNPRVEEAIALRSRELLERLDLEPRRIVAEIARVAFADPRGLFGPDGTPRTPGEIDEDTMAGMAIDIVETAGGCVVRMRRHDKLAALALLGRYYRLFDDDPNAGATVGLAEALAEHRARALERAPTTSSS